MLAKKYRLSSKADYKRVEEEGNIYQMPDFGVAVFDRKDLNPPRFAFVISTKIAKDAVDRNTIRRHMSETIRLMTGYIKDGLDIVFLAKTSILKIPASELVREVRQSVKDCGLLK